MSSILEKPITLEPVQSDGPVDIHIGEDQHLYLFLWIPDQCIIKVPLSVEQYEAVRKALKRSQS